MKVEQRILLRQLAEKYNITFKQAKNIVWSYYQLVAKEMKECKVRDGEFKTLMIPRVGKFFISEKRRYSINEYVKNKNQENGED